MPATSSLPAHTDSDHDPATVAPAPAPGGPGAAQAPATPDNAGVGAAGAGPARTPAEATLWAALAAHPGSTGPALAVAAGIGRSTAAKILARWAADHVATRTPAPADGGPGRAAERWSLTDPTPVSALTDHADAIGTPSPPPTDMPLSPAAEAGDTDEAGDSDDARVAVASSPEPAPAAVAPIRESVAGPARERADRLPAGGLRGLVEDYLREHPTEAFGPSQIGTHLGRSGGAVANALVTLVGAGYAVLVQDKPRRYQLAPAEHTHTDPTHGAS